VIEFEVSVGEGVMDWIMADRDDSGCHVETIACAAGGRGDPCTRWKKSRKVEDNLSLSGFGAGVIPGGACSPRPVRERIEGEGPYTAVIDGRFGRKTPFCAGLQWVRGGVWAFNAANTLGKPVSFPQIRNFLRFTTTKTAAAMKAAARSASRPLVSFISCRRDNC